MKMTNEDAEQLARVLTAGGNLKLPTNPTYAWAAMEYALRGTQEAADGDYGVSGYHDTKVSEHAFDERFNDYIAEEIFQSDVNWFYRSGNSIAQTAQFFNFHENAIIRILKTGGSI